MIPKLDLGASNVPKLQKCLNSPDSETPRDRIQVFARSSIVNDTDATKPTEIMFVVKKKRRSFGRLLQKAKEALGIVAHDRKKGWTEVNAVARNAIVEQVIEHRRDDIGKVKSALMVRNREKRAGGLTPKARLAHFNELQTLEDELKKRSLRRTDVQPAVRSLVALYLEAFLSENYEDLHRLDDYCQENDHWIGDALRLGRKVRADRNESWELWLGSEDVPGELGVSSASLLKEVGDILDDEYKQNPGESWSLLGRAQTITDLQFGAQAIAEKIREMETEKPKEAPLFMRMGNEEDTYGLKSGSDLEENAETIDLAALHSLRVAAESDQERSD